MKRVSTIYVDGELIAEALKKGINISHTVEESLKKTLKRDLSLKELEEIASIQTEALQETHNKIDILLTEIKSMREKEMLAKSKEETDYEQEKQLKLAKLKEKLDNIPEIQQIDINLIYNTKYILEFVDKLRSNYPDLKITVVDLRTYLSTKQSHT